MRRGFKAEAERLAARLRTELGLGAAEQIDLLDLAGLVGVEVRSATDLVSTDRLEQLNEIQPGCFSAATFHLPGNRIVTVLNPIGSNLGRERSDLAHEISHVLLKHEIRRVQRLAGFSFFDCDPEQEEEANWLAGCLLLPRSLLLNAARLQTSAKEIADEHDVSEQMARFRLNASGVYLQVSRGRAIRREQGR